MYRAVAGDILIGQMTTAVCIELVFTAFCGKMSSPTVIQCGDICCVNCKYLGIPGWAQFLSTAVQLL